MADIKYVLTDFDGTVVKMLEHEASDAVRQAVIDAENAGVLVIPVTGRTFDFAQPVFNVLGFKDYCVVDNGATVRKIITGEIVWSHWLTVEKIKEILTVLAPVSSTIEYVEGMTEHEPQEDELSLVSQTAPYVFGSVALDIEQEIIDKLTNISGIDFHITEHPENGTVAFQVTADGASKYHGVQALRQLLDIPRAQTMAIGDGNNDIALFDNADLCVAMGNATEALKAKADYITGTVDEDGFVQAIQKFVLN